LHHHGYPNVLRIAHADTIEPRRSDADDGKRQTVERDGFATPVGSSPHRPLQYRQPIPATRSPPRPPPSSDVNVRPAMACTPNTEEKLPETSWPSAILGLPSTPVARSR